MANEVSAVLREAIYRGRTERVFIVLVQITHDDATGTIRVTSDGQDTVHAGDTYQSRPFRITIPDDVEDKQPSARLTIGNLDQNLVATIRSITSPAEVTVTVVLDDDPNRVERGPWVMQLVDVSYNIDTLRGTLVGPNLLSEPFPGNTYNTVEYPGL